MTETNPGELPLAGTPSTPQLDPPPQPSTSIPELADIIAAGEDAVVMRVGKVTAVELTGSRRVQLDIASTTWVNRVQDCQLVVNDRVSVLQSGAVMLVVGRLTGTDAFTPIGAIMPYAGSVAPTNYLLCQGQSLLRASYPTLFAAIGTTYGAADASHFTLPDLRNRLPIGAGTSFALGSSGGSATMTLTTTHLPSHNHSFSDTTDNPGGHSHSISASTDSAGSHSHSGDGSVGNRSDLLAGGGTNAATDAGTGSTSSAGGHSHGISGSIGSGGGHTHSVSGTTGSAGSGGSFSTTGPYQAVNYIIRAL